jgi:hypothetical protein
MFPSNECWKHEAAVQRYRRLLETYLTDTERRFVERRLLEEQQALSRQDRQQPSIAPALNPKA